MRPALGVVEADEQQMQVHRQAIHGDHLMRLCTGQMGESVHKSIVVVDPWMLSMKMSFHPKTRPIVEFHLQCLCRRFGLKAEAVAREVHGILATVLGHMKLLAQCAQRVVAVEGARFFERGEVLHVAPNVAIMGRAPRMPPRCHPTDLGL